MDVDYLSHGALEKAERRIVKIRKVSVNFFMFSENV